MKKSFLVILAFLLILGLSGCTDDTEELETIKAELEELIQKNADLTSDNVILLADKDALIIDKDVLLELNAELTILLGYDIDYLSMIEIQNESLEDALTTTSSLLEAALLEIDDLELVYNDLLVLVESLNEYITLLEVYVELSPQIIPFMHIDGFGGQEELPIVINFEFEIFSKVKYQITYLSCNSRDANNNYYSVMYLEIDKDTNIVSFISFDEDSSGYYSAGSWGDSNPIPNGVTYEDIETDFIPWLVGKTLLDLEGISIFTNDNYHGIVNTETITDTDLIDAFAGSSVSTNNMIRVVKEMLKYHTENHGS